MGQPNQEPSMEDILASIKRIIAEDGEAATRVVQRPPRKAAAVAVDEPEATSETAVADGPPETEPADPVTPRSFEPSDVLELTSPLPDPPATNRTTEPMDNPPNQILSPAAESASRTAFAALSQLQVRVDEGRENTLDGLVADLLRPMLREWLDRELPAMVERLVSAEVARISGRS